MQEEAVTATPLYMQIATRLRHRIASGELQEGDALPSLRAGGRRWGVNLHTVRRAYEVLERQGLVTTEPRRRTRVAASTAPDPPDHRTELDAFLDRVVERASARFGAEIPELVRRLDLRRREAGGPVWVLECSRSLAETLAERVAEWSGLDARPWLVERAAEVPDGYHLATYYHYAQVRNGLAGRSHPPAFFGVTIEEMNLARIAEAARRAGRIALLGIDGATGGAIAADLRSALARPTDVELILTEDPVATLEGVPREVPVVVSPENWDRLPSSLEGDARIFQLVLRPDERDLARIGALFGWRRNDVSAVEAGSPQPDTEAHDGT